MPPEIVGRQRRKAQEQPAQRQQASDPQMIDRKAPGDVRRVERGKSRPVNMHTRLQPGILEAFTPALCPPSYHRRLAIGTAPPTRAASIQSSAGPAAGLRTRERGKAHTIPLASVRSRDRAARPAPAPVETGPVSTDRG